MPSEKVIEIILRLRDEVSKGIQQVQSSLHKFSNFVKELGTDMRKTGREISSIGSSMTMAGGALTAPLIAAYKEAGKYNAEISRQLNDTKNVFQRLSISIGEALLPVMRDITDQIARMVNWWESLDKTTREKVIQTIFNLGKNMIILGTSLVVVGKALSALGNLALLTSALAGMSPVVAAVGAGFAALALAMWKCKTVADAVLNTIQWLVKHTPNIYNIIRKFSGMSSDEFFGKQGDWAKGFDDFKKDFADFSGFYKDFLNSMGKANTAPPGNFFEGFKLGLEQTRQALASWRDMGLQTTLDLFNGMQSNFKTLFVDAFSGQLKKAKDYFADFGNTLINIFADVCAKIIERWMTTMIITGLGKFFSSGASGEGVSQGIYGSENFVNVPMNTVATPYYHQGGIIRAHSGLRLASDEVPIIAQTGERILSRSQNLEYERGVSQRGISITINPTAIIKAYDFADFYAHKEEFQAIMAESIDLNKLRKVINANR